ncbi:MAG TPA: pentapeptide repeat-containing protein [Actinophytocola sp.]|uniref:pentapeptide repeat-containing protein n=1 Tax=Actinophytocola sp. TaxID=1872138 RepID=UPI002E03ED43|nr:pentapeptide repeat-containing protein [Actinophytocola sp.]
MGPAVLARQLRAYGDQVKGSYRLADPGRGDAVRATVISGGDAPHGLRVLAAVVQQGGADGDTHRVPGRFDAWDPDHAGTSQRRRPAPGQPVGRPPASGADFRKADLREAWLRDTCLPAADLRDADLRNADLQGADLDAADLRGANLDGADLRGRRSRR